MLIHDGVGAAGPYERLGAQFVVGPDEAVDFGPEFGGAPEDAAVQRTALELG